MVIGHQRFKEVLRYGDRLGQGVGWRSIRLVFRLLRVHLQDFRLRVEDGFHNSHVREFGISREFLLQLQE